MGRRVEIGSLAGEIPGLRAWGTRLAGSTQSQYFTLIRQFFGDFPGLTPPNAGRDLLVKWCASVQPPWRRTKAVSALDSYFAFLTELGLIERHPAPGLSRRVAHEIERRMIAGQLAASGCAEDVIAGLTWRDVAKVVADHPSSIDRYLGPSMRAVLVDEWLEHLRGASADTLDEALDRSIFG